MITPPDSGPLREQKRRATMVAIENSATALVLEHGYDTVTVDQICADAGVSKRTFFNYVPTKEAAVVGTTPEDIDESARTAFHDAADPDVPRALLRLYLGAFAAARTADDAEAVARAQRRREIFRRNPALGVTRMRSSTIFQNRLVDGVVDHLGRHPGSRRLSGTPVEGEARVHVALVAASAQVGLAAWLTRESATFDDLDDDCLAAMRHLALLATTTDTAGSAP